MEATTIHTDDITSRAEDTAAQIENETVLTEVGEIYTVDVTTYT